MSNKKDYLVDKLIKKIQVLLTEPEFEELNNIILSEALKNKQRPRSVSAFVRELVKQEIKRIDNINDSETK
tara:strand:+ start:1251 stop:1463 length:213 start_codon:yes stop_codon:yes gene_type:complete